jgi:hypothetical protein
VFLRLKTYLTLVREEAIAVGMANLHRIEAEKSKVDLHAERREVKRLTDVIIHLKEQGHVLPPGHADSFWGRYVMGDNEEGKAPQEVVEPPSAEEREVTISDAEFHKELEEALKNEV